MNVKKIMFIISLMFVITGCNANYSLEISDNKIYEKFSVIESDKEKTTIPDEFDKTFLDYSKMYGKEIDLITDTTELYSQESSEYNYKYYDKKFIDEDGKIGFELSTDFDYNNFSYSSIANEIIPGFSVTYDGRILSIRGGSSWNFLNNYKTLDEVNINIKTDYKVLSTNLKKYNNNYVWTIKNGDIKKSKDYYITIDTKTIVNNKSDSNDILFFLLLFLAVIIGFIIYDILRRKKYNN